MEAEDLSQLQELVLQENMPVPVSGPQDVPQKAPRSDFTPSAPQKAAIILSVLEIEDAIEILRSFPEGVLTSFARAVMNLRAVPNDVLEEVIDEFVDLVGDGPGVRGGVDQAKRMLGGIMDEPQLARMLEKIENPEKGVVWERLGNVPLSEAGLFLQLEHPQTIAFVLSRLRSDKAAAILEGFDRELAQTVVMRLSRVAAPEDSVVTQVERVIAREFLSAINERSSTVRPAELIGNLMNNVSSTVRDGFLEYIQENDTELAQEVIKTMFTFADISTRVVPTDVSMIVKDMAEDRLLLALRYAKDQDNPSYDFIMSNLSRRLSERMVEDIDAMEAVKARDGEAAQMETVNMIQNKAKMGEISLREIDPDD